MTIGQSFIPNDMEIGLLIDGDASIQYHSPTDKPVIFLNERKIVCNATYPPDENTSFIKNKQKNWTSEERILFHFARILFKFSVAYDALVLT